MKKSRLAQLLCIARFLAHKHGANGATYNHVCNDGCNIRIEKIGSGIDLEFQYEGKRLDSTFVLSKNLAMRSALEFCSLYL